MEALNTYVSTEIKINATSEKVWSILIDCDKLKEWSSSFIGISTEKLVKGEVFISYFKIPVTGKVIELEHVCTDYDEGVKFGWSSCLIEEKQNHHVFNVKPTIHDSKLFRQENGFHELRSNFIASKSK